MGQTVSVHAQVEILAPPATVRSIFLDFAQYEKWHQGWEITPVDPAKKPSELKNADTLKVSMHGMTFHPTVTHNTSESFIWEGSLWGLLVGKHEFAFSPSKENPGGTTFVQSEEFRGPLTVLYWPWRNTEHISPNWEAFNVALKEEAEKTS
ncbi:hypothetical protein QQX98_003850 [Neonectria punicea]|uniref:SRPBCC domain-containing protein n=1 Tax=Neonectria punicea TaxID=979145 RepID=A0ABR1HBW8_9HYPO